MSVMRVVLRDESLAEAFVLFGGRVGGVGVSAAPDSAVEELVAGQFARSCALLHVDGDAGREDAVDVAGISA